MAKPFLIFILLMLAFDVTAFAGQCGQKIIQPDDGHPGARVLRLGSGIGGGTVFLIQPTSGEKFARKRYRVGENQGGAEASLANDITALKILQDLLGEFMALDGLRIVRPRNHSRLETGFVTDGFILDLEYVEGTVLEDKLKANDEEAARISRRYLSYLKELRLVFATANAIGKIKLEGMRDESWLGQPGLRMDILVNGAYLVKIWIKPDNIIVTSSGEMVIIDPY